MNKSGDAGSTRSTRERKTERRSFRLGGGEFERPGETRVVEVGKGPPARIAIGTEAPRSVGAARELFFTAAGKVEPAFVEELDGAPGGRPRVL